MKVKIIEYYQDANCVLVDGNEYEVSQKLGDWLISVKKAVRVEPVIVENVTHVETTIYDVEPQFEQPEPPEPPQVQNRKRGRGAK